MALSFNDFFDVSRHLSSEHKLVQSEVAKWVKARISPHLAQWFEEGSLPKNLAQEMGALGYLGSQLQGYGCPGLDSLSYGLIMQELERADSGLRSLASVQGSLVMYPIHTFGSEEQKEKWLPLLAQGLKIGCFGLTEPDFGSNPSGMRTTATKVTGGYLLNGSKTWITNSPLADVAVVWAKVDGNSIHGFLVEKGTVGFEAPEIKHKLSLRASVTGSLFFKDCFIPEENLLPKSDGLKSALMCLNQARFGIAFGVLGAAEDCISEALEYSKQRIVFDKPLAGFQLVQQKLATLTTRLTTARLLALELCKLKEEKKIQPAQISMAKQNNVQFALEAARTCRDILGANGISLEYRSMRHACNLESVFTYEGTNDVQILIIGQAITGLNAFN